MRGVVLGLVVLGALASSAKAADVTFSGTLSDVCTLAVPTSGTLGLDGDGVLGSEEGVGTPATLTILSVGSNEVDVDPPVWVTTPGGYDDTGELLEVAYSGVGGLALIDQDYIGTATNFSVTTLPVTALTVNARATNDNGFEAGGYSMKVVVTCS